MDSKIYLGWHDIEELVDNLCYQIVTNHPEIKYVHGLSRGGLIPAVMVSHILGIKYINIPTCIEDTMIIDDICDSGVTLEEWENYNTAVLHYKPHTSCLKPNIHAVIHEGDEWIIYPWERDDSEAIQDYLK
jgi:hypoxanthine phosphoribosyltransferase